MTPSRTRRIDPEIIAEIQRHQSRAETVICEIPITDLEVPEPPARYPLARTLRKGRRPNHTAEPPARPVTSAMDPVEPAGSDPQVVHRPRPSAPGTAEAGASPPPSESPQPPAPVAMAPLWTFVAAGAAAGAIATVTFIVFAVLMLT